MCNLFNSFWLSKWSRYITRGNTNPGYPLLFQNDSPLIWIHRLRESLSRNKNSFGFSLLQVYGRSITNALLLKFIFLLSCCLCSYVFSITVSNRTVLRSCMYLLTSYFLKSVVDAHTRLYLARVTIRIEAGLTGIIFYRLLSSYKPEGTNNDIDNEVNDDLHGIQSKIRLEIEEDDGNIKNKSFRSFQNIFKSSDLSQQQDKEAKTITYKRSFKYLLSDPDIFSMLVGDISSVQLFLNSLIDCLLLPVNIFLTWILLSKQVGFITALPGIITFSIFLISSFVFQILGTIYKAPFMEHRDQRLSICHEILGLLRLIRIMGVEDLAFDRIMKSRTVETKYNRKRLVRTQFGSFLEYHTQRATQLIVFVIFYLFNGTSLNLSSALASIHILHSLASPLRGIPVTFIEGLISLLRIRTFISSHLDNDCEYLEEDDDTSTNCEFTGAIDFTNERSDSNTKCFNSRCRSSSNPSTDSISSSFIRESHCIIKSHLCSENLQPLFGRCVIITGSSGCGKTSIIKSILDCKDNELCYAYSGQNSWIPQGTVRSAILFGKPWNEDLYRLVTDICQLQHDFQTWKEGDLRIIDEGGSSLSGGQRTRVTLARCLYHQSDASLYLFDDIFLNLDPNVGIKIFHRLFGNNGFLNNSYSRVILSIDLTSLLYFINNQIDKNWTLIHIIHLNDKNVFFSGSLTEYLTLINKLELDENNSEYLFIENNSMNLNKNIRVSEISHGSDLNKEPVSSDSFLSPVSIKHVHKNTEYFSSPFKSSNIEKELNSGELEIIHRISSQISTLQSKNISIESLHSIIGATPTSSGTGASSSTLNLSISFGSGKTFFKSAPLSGDLITETEITSGKKSSFQIYKWYFGMVGGLWCVLLLASCIAKSLLDRYSDTFISYNDSNNNPNFIIIYTLIVILQGIFCAILFIGEAIGGINASNMAHNNLVQKMLFSPFWIYDSTPTSYLMNRLSTDILVLDECPLKRIASVIVPVIDFLIQISILSYAVPLSFPITLLVTIMTYKIVCQRYISTYIRAQKVALSVLSPMYSLFSQLINGIVIIHAFNAQRHLLNQFLIQIEHLQRIRLLQHIASQWAAIRLQVYTLPLILFILLIPVDNNWRYLALLYSLLISETTSVITYRFASMEKDMCSSERIFQLVSKEFQESKNNQNEDKNRVSDNKVVSNKIKTNLNYQLIPNGIFSEKPVRTGIKIIDLEVGYTDIKGASYNNVLEGINANIEPFEHIGIVGRTGSGKSTLILALLGLVEYRKGQILLDDVPISSLTIKERRKIVGVLPQTPLVLKDWTIRNFLDPYNEFTDEEICKGLQECLLDSSLKELHKDLSLNVNSLSASQLRYLSIAKLVISSHQYKMILIDEPPPHADGDQGFQRNISKILSSHFRHCNIFIVAHHVESIRDCSNIWILAQRKLVKTIHPSSVPTQYELAQILTNYE